MNEYLHIFCEIGWPGFLLFILFLAALLKRQKKGVMRSITMAIALALFFNNFFWFPECLLLFWVFLAAGDYLAAPDREVKPVLLWAVVAFFIAFQVLDFQALHPLLLTRQKGVAYDYGFWPLEANYRGRFSWTRGAAGKYVAAAAAREVAIFCEAPPGWLHEKKMTVDLFWRGRSWQRIVFAENGLKKILLPFAQEGFFEIRVRPTFNLKALDLGADGRELGVQILERGKSPL